MRHHCPAGKVNLKETDQSVSNVVSSLEGDPEELMFQYFKKFGDKPCCFTDLKVFVDLLPAAQCTQVRVSQSSVSVQRTCACTLVQERRYSKCFAATVLGEV